MSAKESIETEEKFENAKQWKEAIVSNIYRELE